MSLQEQKKFISSIHPFENLTLNELDDIAEAFDVVHFKEGTTVQSSQSEPKFLYFILKGLIQEKQEDEVLAVYSKNEIFDSASLIKNFSKNSFVTAQESICYTLPRELFMSILSQNQQLENYFFQSDRKSTRLNSSHQIISYAVFCLK